MTASFEKTTPVFPKRKTLGMNFDSSQRNSKKRTGEFNTLTVEEKFDEQSVTNLSKQGTSLDNEMSLKRPFQTPYQSDINANYQRTEVAHFQQLNRPSSIYQDYNPENKLESSDAHNGNILRQSENVMSKKDQSN